MKNGEMDAKIGPKVVMDLSTFKNGGWNHLRPSKPTCDGSVHG